MADGAVEELTLCGFFAGEGAGAISFLGVVKAFSLRSFSSKLIWPEAAGFVGSSRFLFGAKIGVRFIVGSNGFGAAGC